MPIGTGVNLYDHDEVRRAIKERKRVRCLTRTTPRPGISARLSTFHDRIDQITWLRRILHHE
jgi:hypothetical protein